MISFQYVYRKDLNYKRDGNKENEEARVLYAYLSSLSLFYKKFLHGRLLVKTIEMRNLRAHDNLQYLCTLCDGGTSLKHRYVKNYYNILY